MIEHNVSSAEEYVEKAAVQLKEAVVMQTAVMKVEHFNFTSIGNTKVN